MYSNPFQSRPAHVHNIHQLSYTLPQPPIYIPKIQQHHARTSLYTITRSCKNWSASPTAEMKHLVEAEKASKEKNAYNASERRRIAHYAKRTLPYRRNCSFPFSMLYICIWSFNPYLEPDWRVDAIPVQLGLAAAAVSKLHAEPPETLRKDGRWPYIRSMPIPRQGMGSRSDE